MRIYRQVVKELTIECLALATPRDFDEALGMT